MSKTEQKKWSWWRTAAAITAVVVVAGGAGAALYWWQGRESGEHTHPGEYIFSDEVKNAQKLTLEKDYDKAHEAINSALDKPNIAAKEQYDLLIQQGVAYENQQDYAAALESYRKAETVQETFQVVQYIAYTADRLGSKELAATYFEKAIAMIPDDGSVPPNFKEYLEGRLKAVEGSQASP